MLLGQDGAGTHLNRARSAIAPLTTVADVALNAQPNIQEAQ